MYVLGAVSLYILTPYDVYPSVCWQLGEFGSIRIFSHFIMQSDGRGQAN